MPLGTLPPATVSKCRSYPSGYPSLACLLPSLSCTNHGHECPLLCLQPHPCCLVPYSRLLAAPVDHPQYSPVHIHTSVLIHRLKSNS
ncbi:hypothetical protein Hanom_Chr04g00332141 [Helianthus anomalus]